MGYYTKYTLTWEPLPSTKTKVCDHVNDPNAKYCSECGIPLSVRATNIAIHTTLSNIQENGTSKMYGINEYGEGHDSCKWYEHEEEMKTFSQQFPTTLFKLYGVGEESGDIWWKYFVNGKMQLSRAEVVFAPFDAKKLA